MARLAVAAVGGGLGVGRASEVLGCRVWTAVADGLVVLRIAAATAAAAAVVVVDDEEREGG